MVWLAGRLKAPGQMSPETRVLSANAELPFVHDIVINAFGVEMARSPLNLVLCCGLACSHWGVGADLALAPWLCHSGDGPQHRCRRICLHSGKHRHHYHDGHFRRACGHDGHHQRNSWCSASHDSWLYLWLWFHRNCRCTDGAQPSHRNHSASLLLARSIKVELS